MGEPIVVKGLTQAQAEATAKAQSAAGATTKIVAEGSGLFSVEVTLASTTTPSKPSAPGSSLIGRCMYVHKLATVLKAEGSVDNILAKAAAARLSAIWVKVADGASKYANVINTEQEMKDLVGKAHSQGIKIWGWHVPHCRDVAAAQAEAKVFGDMATQFRLDGLIMDAEGGAEYFKGGIDEARLYASAIRQTADSLGVPLGLSSNDIPDNISGWTPRFNVIAGFAQYNFPQTYYGASPSVQSRVDRAQTANAGLKIPFIPVGAGFLGTAEGGCASAADCAQRATQFIQLCKQRQFQGCAFWVWDEAPAELWSVLTAPEA